MHILFDHISIALIALGTNFGPPASILSFKQLVQVREYWLQGAALFYD